MLKFRTNAWFFANLGNSFWILVRLLSYTCLWVFCVILISFLFLVLLKRKHIFKQRKPFNETDLTSAYSVHVSSYGIWNIGLVRFLLFVIIDHPFTLFGRWVPIMMLLGDIVVKSRHTACVVFSWKNFFMRVAFCNSFMYCMLHMKYF